MDRNIGARQLYGVRDASRDNGDGDYRERRETNQPGLHL